MIQKEIEIKRYRMRHKNIQKQRYKQGYKQGYKQRQKQRERYKDKDKKIERSEREAIIFSPTKLITKLNTKKNINTLFIMARKTKF